jgi:hypothetical protein
MGPKFWSRSTGAITLAAEKILSVLLFSEAAMFACPSLVAFCQPAQWAEFAAN